MANLIKFCADIARRTADTDIVKNVMSDLTQLSSLWNYLFLGLYVWIAAYLVLYHADTCGSTVVMTTGGIVGTVFAGYVWKSHMDNKIEQQPPQAPLVPGQPDPGVFKDIHR